MDSLKSGFWDLVRGYRTIGEAILHPFENFKQEFSEGAKAFGVWLDDGTYTIFIISGIVGMYFIMAGEKKIGTKITSLSLLIYLLIRVVIGAYA